MTADAPTEGDPIRLLIDSWVAVRAGTLDPDRQAVLDRERPQWQCEAANLIAEGVLAYVMVEMDEPALTHDKEVDPHETASPEKLAVRLGAQIIEFVDYRGDLPRVARLARH
jgi:hypothetical protein